jgi:predicted glycoside hydrolase/deacetylase ChbG (UPF0249 family)
LLTKKGSTRVMTVKISDNQSMKPFILCADDYGLSQPINEAIIELIQLKRLDAVSCMVNMGHWDKDALLLKPYSHDVQIGLHFNLTEKKSLTPLPKSHFGSLKRLMICSHLHGLKQRLIEREFEAQLDRFMQVMGKAPDFIDSHQYIHQFPVIRQALVQVYQKKFKDKKPYIRVAVNSLCDAFKRSFKNPKQLIIALTGALSLKRVLNRFHIPYNNGFSGIYDFSTHKPFSTLFESFIKELNGRCGSG